MKKTQRILLATVLVSVYFAVVIALLTSKHLYVDRRTIVTEPQQSKLPDIVKRVKSGVIHLECPSWQGSGFVVGPNLIVTARHCVKGVEDFTITTDDGHKLHATRAISSKDHDVAFIYVDDLTCVAKERGTLAHKVELSPLELGSIKDCKLGESIFAIGSPFGIDNFNSVTQGILSAEQRDFDSGYTSGWGWSTLFQTDTNGEGGNS